MLTIDNSRLLQSKSLNFGMKLQPKMLQNHNYNKNLYPNLSGALNNDVFVKNTDSSAKNVSFGAYYDEYNSEKINDVKLESDYYKTYATEVQKKWDEVWEWTSKRPRYQTYFKKLNIEKPKLVFVTKRDYPDYTPDKYLKYDEGAPTRYNWINNTIIVDTDYCPNVILASQGRIALTPKDVASDFISRNNTPNVSEGSVGAYQFEDLQKRSLDFAISESASTYSNYFSILDPKEAAELTPALLAHEAEHVVAMHVLLNTAGIDMQRLKDAFNDLNDADMLPPQTTEHWAHSYPYKYRKQLSTMEFGKDDVWKIRDDSGNSLKRISHNKLLDEFFGQSGDLENLLELDARYASISYLDRQKYTGFNEASQEKLDMALDFQESSIDEDIRKRLRWTNLSRAAARVRGKKPGTSGHKKGTKTNDSKKK